MSILTKAAGVFAALCITAAATGDAWAKDEGDLLVRLRGVGFFTDTDGTTNTLGGDAETSDATMPELDFTYFFTENIAAELILATFSHNVSVKNSTSGDLDLGDVWTLPPVLTLQYHFMPKEQISPYVGAGINYTILYNAEAGHSVNSVNYSNEFGWALQAGVDYQLDDRWSLNFDVKKVFVETDISVNGGAITANDTNLDPLAVSVGLGYRF